MYSSSRSSRLSESSQGDECKICFEGTVDCVLYMCGHMCLCYQVNSSHTSSKHLLTMSSSVLCSSGRGGEAASVPCVVNPSRMSLRSTGNDTRTLKQN